MARLGLWLVVAGLGCSRTALEIEPWAEHAGDGVDTLGRGAEAERCREVAIEEEVAVVEVPGNVLLLFDRSGSMMQPWNGVERWQVAGGAIAEAVRSASPALTVGAIFFPSPDGMETCIDPSGIACLFVPQLVVAMSCFVAPIDSPEHLPFAPAPEFLVAFETSATAGGEPRYAPLGGGQTPLSEALVVASDALHAGTRPGITSLVVVTDGDPNCAWDAMAATQALDGLREIGVDTYVLGLPGVDPNAMSVLGELASHGGTNAFITPEDSSALERHFRDIIEDTASVGLESCSVPLDPPLDSIDDVRLLVGDRADARALRAIDERGQRAWSIAPGGTTLQLHGATCTQALEGGLHDLRLEAGCTSTRVP